MNYRTLKCSFLANLLAASWIIPASAQTLTVTNGLQLWLKADAGVTAGAGGKVTAWQDQSGKGNNASQSVADMSPLLVNDAINGKPVLRFDGVDDFLEVADSDSVSITGDITTFFLVKFDDFATYRAVWAKTLANQPAPNDWYALPGSGIPRAYRGDGLGANGSADGGKALTAGNYLVAGWDMAGTLLTHYLGGFASSSRVVAPAAIADADTSLLIGTRDDRVTIMKGDIAEVLIYDRALTAAERRALVVYLNQKYLYGNIDPAGDLDQDGLTNLEEEDLLTDLTDPDTDGDGLSDGDEVHRYKSDPLSTDTDGDLLSDGFEVNVLHTDPTKADTDGDGFSDYYEYHLLTDPLDPNSKPKKTTVNLFTGPDPGQGLDLTGNFVYAISFGTDTRDPLGGQVHDALFTADTVDGVTVVASQVADNWDKDVNFGDSPEQQVLSSVLSSIRWSDALNAMDDQDHRAVTVTFSKLQVGASYKLQLLFGEYLWARGFDISINGRPAAQALAPFQWQGGFVGPGGATPRTNGVVLTHTFIATDTNATIVLDGRPVTDPAMADHNAIINGATLELVASAVDSDGDGLWDAWELENFGNLDQKADGDPDGDGLTNAQEFRLNTDPNKSDTDGDGLKDGEEVNTYKTDPAKADTDGDGLKDGDEVNIYKTDPLKADTDGDGLSDGLEVLTYKTDPLKADTDGDGVDDGKEVAFGSDPLKAELPTVFTNIVIQAFSGGDPGEGLDLQGTFLYAFNVSSDGAAGKAGDADFTADNAPGIKVTAQNDIPSWDMPDFGETPNDKVLDKVMQGIRWSAAPARWKVELSGLIPGSTYKLQLLFYEQCCSGRGFNVVVDGNIIASNFFPNVVQGGVNNTSAGAVIAAEFTTQRDKVVILGDGPGADSPDITDHNAILDGVTLEILNQVTRPTIGLTKEADGKLTITTDSTLQVADTVTGTYSNLPGKSVTVDPKAAGGQKFYRGAR